MGSRICLSGVVQAACGWFQASLLGLMALSILIEPLAAAGLKTPRPASSAPAAQAPSRDPLSPEQKVWQLLNRITFGPRRGDFERVRQMGLVVFLDQQLHPEKIDDSAVQARVAKLATINMSTAELIENYPPPRLAQRTAQARNSESPREPSTPGLQNEMTNERVRTGREIARLEGPQRVLVELGQEETLRAIYGNRQLEGVMVQFWMNHFNIFASKGADRWLLTSFERDTIRPHVLGKFEELLVATAKSPAMLFYLDNWLSSTPNPTYRNNPRGPWNRRAPRGGFYGRPVFRRFGGPLGRGVFAARLPYRPATNPIREASAAPNCQAQPKQARGLNENYARELMELHTLGVDGGYTQKDVIEVARCLTGWTIERPQQGGGFIFRPQMHDFGPKIVLDRKIPAGRGMEDGLKVLHILAHEPATAHHIAFELCRRFIADDPPESVVARSSQTFLHSDGDIRTVLKTILTAPEFYSQAAYRAKVKSPFELVASALRALDGKTDAGPPLLFSIARMGQPMFQYQAPTGFPDRADTWINSGSLLARIKFAGQLAANRIPGTEIYLEDLAESAPQEPPSSVMDRLAWRLFGGTLATTTRQAVLEQWGAQEDFGLAAGARPEAVAMLAALMLASPDFQRR